MLLSPLGLFDLRGYSTMVEKQAADVARPTVAGERNGREPLARPSSGELTTALVHLYRAEVGRSVRWRTRLDVTTNWAVLTTGAGMTFALGDAEPQRHVVILLSSLLLAFFLVLEARRYRLYDVWQRRVSLLERSFYGPLLDPAGAPAGEGWRATLAESLREPRYGISLVQAMAWRLRRNYIWLFVANAMIWLVKIDLHPAPTANAMEFIRRAAVGPLPGWLMLVFGLLFNGTLVAITLTGGRRPDNGDLMRC
jgi:uncharacterized membrane protein